MRRFRSRRRMDVRRCRKPPVRGTLMTETELFAAALEKPTPEERAAYLAEACAGDEPLRRRVEALLRAHAEPGDLPGLPATGAYEPPAERPGARVGPYKPMEQIGEGGLGLVFGAGQTE